MTMWFDIYHSKCSSLLTRLKAFFWPTLFLLKPLAKCLPFTSKVWKTKNCSNFFVQCQRRDWIKSQSMGWKSRCDGILLTGFQQFWILDIAAITLQEEEREMEWEFLMLNSSLQVFGWVAEENGGSLHCNVHSLDPRPMALITLWHATSHVLSHLIPQKNISTGEVDLLPPGWVEWFVYLPW